MTAGGRRTARAEGQTTMIFGLGIFAIALVTIAAIPNSSVAQGASLKDQLVGTWIYVSSTAKRMMAATYRGRANAASHLLLRPMSQLASGVRLPTILSVEVSRTPA